MRCTTIDYDILSLYIVKKEGFQKWTTPFRLESFN